MLMFWFDIFSTTFCLPQKKIFKNHPRGALDSHFYSDFFRELYFGAKHAKITFVLYYMIVLFYSDKSVIW